MAVPARKTSKTRKRLRRTHYKLSVPGMSACLTVVNSESHITYAQLAVTTVIRKS